MAIRRILEVTSTEGEEYLLHERVLYLEEEILDQVRVVHLHGNSHGLKQKNYVKEMS